MASLLSCYFPTTVVIIDDDENFVETVRNLIQTDLVRVETFTDPRKALDYINNESAVNSLNYSRLTREGEDDTSDWHTVMLNINELHSEIYSFDRFRHISTVLVDYCMPEINGVQFCAEIVDPNIQKILLTGYGDGKIAIEAFNNGYINQFVKKDYSDFTEETQGCLQKSLYRYFKGYTDYVSHYLAIQGNDFLKDPVFVNFFNSTCLSKQYIEYYMLDRFGSYLLLEKSGRAVLLSVLSEEEMQRIVEVGMDSGEAEERVLSLLQSREYMLVSHNKEGMLPPIKNWENYLQPARKLMGQKTYYFSVANSDFLDIDFSKVKTYADFCKQNES